MVRSDSATQRVAESGEIIMKKKLVKRKRLKKEEFIVDYVRNHTNFCGEPPTKEEINSAYNLVKNIGKRKRVKPTPEPEMSKEEFIALSVRNSQLLWGETPTEKDLNREWDLIVYERQYNAIRGKTKKEKEKKQQAFVEYMEQEMKRRYSPVSRADFLQVSPQ